MDPITHALLGSSTIQAVYAKKLKCYAILIGCIAGMLPDLDIFISSADNPILFMIYHRHFTHALIFIPLGGLIAAAISLLFIKKSRPYWPIVIIAAIAAYATHGLLDATTTYGTLLLWPFSNKRIAWDFMPIIDPVFTGILLIGVILAWRKNSINVARITLFFALSYIGFGAWQHYRGQTLEQQLIASRHQISSHFQIMPDIGQLFSWRGIYIEKQNIDFDEIKTPLLQHPYSLGHFQVPLVNSKLLPATMLKNRLYMQDYKTFLWFTNGFAGIASYQPLVIADMRYIRSYQPLISLWGLEFSPLVQNKHAYFKRNVPLQLAHNQ